MTFTYSLVAPVSDLARVRFALGDTVEASAKFTDEEINFQISEQTTWTAAVIVLIQGLIAKLMIPNFTADWLTVDAAVMRKDWIWLLGQKRNEYGISALSVETAYAYRPDSRQFESPTFTDVQDTE